MDRHVYIYFLLGWRGLTDMRMRAEQRASPLLVGFMILVPGFGGHLSVLGKCHQEGIQFRDSLYSRKFRSQTHNQRSYGLCSSRCMRLVRQSSGGLVLEHSNRLQCTQTWNMFRGRAQADHFARRSVLLADEPPFRVQDR